MRIHTIDSFEQFTFIIAKGQYQNDKPSADRERIFLYRGQLENKPLIPSIARNNPNVNTIETEKKMLSEFVRKSRNIIKDNFDDWELLIFAQHFGLKTRLLDWTSNPLVALWFACNNDFDNDSYFYILKDAQIFELNKEEYYTPFEIQKTQVLKPYYNNDRIIAQSGWFTAHCFSIESNMFVDLDNDEQFRDAFYQFIIPKTQKKDMLKKLNLFGINSHSVFPDISGLCKHLNWEFEVYF